MPGRADDTSDTSMRPPEYDTPGENDAGSGADNVTSFSFTADWSDDENMTRQYDTLEPTSAGSGNTNCASSWSPS